MKKFDFVFVFEGKNRELESDCLIACELEKRGYKVGFISTLNQIKKRESPLDTRVAIAFAMYDDELFKFIDYHVINCDKIVNMQWEQLYPNGVIALSKNALYNRKGKAHSFGICGNALKAVHFTWGNELAKRLVTKFGVPENRLFITGRVDLDFFRPELKNYFKSAQEIKKEFGIKKEKKVVLFISTFTFVNVSERTKKSDSMQNSGQDFNTCEKLATKSQKIIMEWIERLLSERSDIAFVYRPHPSENDSYLLLNMKKKFKNFHIINEYSVKQWILVSDNVYTWLSTSITDVMVADKPCGILRPIQIPFEYDLEIYNNAKFITEYNTFVYSIDNKMDPPMSKNELLKYYFIDVNKPSYKIICDILEKVISDESYNTNCEHIRRTKDKTKAYNRFAFLSEILIHTKFTRKILKFLCPSWTIDYENYKYLDSLYKKNHTSKKEIALIKKRIKSALNETDNNYN